MTHQNFSRRTFLANSAASLAAMGAGVFLGRRLMADRMEIAAAMKDIPEAHPLTPALNLGTKSLKALEEVEDYQALFIKRELIGRRLVDTKMELKFREDPFSVYLKFISPNAGREAIYVAGQNNNTIQVHDTGFAALAGTLSLDPDGKYAMDGNRYPVTRIGMKLMAATILEQWVAESKLEGVNVNLYPKARIGKVSCQAIETSHTTASKGAKYQMTRLYIDNENGLPIRVQQYAFPTRRNDKPALVEDYLYSNLKTNVGLNDVDFSTRNPNYNY